VLSYDPSADTIEIVAYNRKSAQNNPINVYGYTFMVFSRIAEVSCSMTHPWTSVKYGLTTENTLGIFAILPDIQEVR
jgi:hypothetical protein